MLLFPLCSEGARVCRPPHCEPLARRVGTAPTPQPTPASRCPAGVSRQGPRAPPLRAERERRRPRPAGEAGRGPGPVGSAARSRFSTFPCEARDRGRLSVGPSDKAKLERHPPPKDGGRARPGVWAASEASARVGALVPRHDPCWFREFENVKERTGTCTVCTGPAGCSAPLFA